MYKHVKKSVKMNPTFKRISVIFILISLLICTGCTNTTSGKAPSNYEKLHSLIGKPITEACKVLGLDEAEVLAANENKQDYRLPETVEFAGITWNVDLSFDWANEVVLAFLYVKEYDNDTEQSAKDATELGAHLIKHYGEPYNPADDDLGKLSAEALQEKVANAEYFTKFDRWALDDQITDDMRSFHEDWVANYTGDNIPEHLTYEMNLSYGAKDGDFARLSLEYRFRAV